MKSASSFELSRFGRVAQEDADELCWYVGDSRARFGDLHHLQRLALALRDYSASALSLVS